MVKVTIVRDRTQEEHPRGSDYYTRDGALFVIDGDNGAVAVYPAGEWARAVVEKG